MGELKRKVHNFLVNLTSWFLIAAFVVASFGVLLLSLRWVLSLVGVM